MKDFFKEIFEYHHHFNQRLIAQLKELEQDLPDRTLPLFSHSINAQQIWNARIAGDAPLGVHQVHTLDECSKIDRDNYNTTLAILEERDLNEAIKYANSKGTGFSNYIRDILFHVANHFTHHRGQIISDIRQSGAVPIVTDYIFYKR